MKLLNPLIVVALLLNVTIAGAQVKQLPSAAYDWSDLNNTAERNVLNGRTTHFDSFEVDIFAVKPGEKSHQSSTSADTEELIILKEGKLGITVDKNRQVLGPGSIAFLMPGGKYSYENKGTAQSIFYKLKFNSNFPVDKERGKSNGGSFMVDWDKLVMKENERGGRRDFFNKPTSTCKKFEMHVTTLNEGLPSHPPHTHAEEEIILMIKGNGIMSIDDRDYEVSPGSVVFLATESLHGIRNSGKGQCEYFAFQWK